MKTFNMSQKELKCMIIFDRIRNKELTQVEAAQILKLSVRQVKRKQKRYFFEGPGGLVHRSRGKLSNRRVKDSVVAEILTLLQETCSMLNDKAGPTFLSDQLAKRHNIRIDHETLRRLMINKGLWKVSNRKQRRHHWRERKHHIGELVQIDGSLHLWFAHEYSTLIAFIDDATGRIMWAEFVDRESTEDLGRMTHDYVKQYGRPLALYSDRGSTYKISNNKDGKVHKTQYQRMLQELDVELIHARSPQAKGRVERLFKTLQDRLVKELELEGITTRDAANIYLKNIYIPEHNAKFTVEPQEKADFHRSIDGFDLHTIFCLKFERTINNDYTICFKDKWFQLERSQPISIKRKQGVVIHQYFDGTIDVIKQNKRLSFKRITKQQKPPKKKMENYEDGPYRRIVYQKPPKSHPWLQRFSDKRDISNKL